MKIAILGSFSCHLECIGFLLEIFKNDDICIYLLKNSDKYKNINHYLNFYKFNVKYNEFSNNIVNTYDKVIKLTSNDYCLDDKKIISILHLDGDTQKKCKSNIFLSLTPYVKGKNIYYTFPIYSPKLNPSIKSKNIFFIGYYKNKNFDKDTINFINLNNDYHFYFVTWGDRNYSNIKNLKNVTLLQGISADKVHNLINNSKFVLSKKYINYDRFSGQLGLAMSYEKPLIIDSKTKQIYDLPGIAFHKDYYEIGKLDNITEDQYNLIKQEIKIKKEQIISNNKEIFKKI